MEILCYHCAMERGKPLRPKYGGDAIVAGECSGCGCNDLIVWQSASLAEEEQEVGNAD